MFDTFRENDDGTKMGILVEDMVIEGWPVKEGLRCVPQRLAFG